MSVTVVKIYDETSPVRLRLECAACGRAICQDAPYLGHDGCRNVRGEWRVRAYLDNMNEVND